ncbi:MAG: NTP transferase domain-containing protein [Saccharolobus sp.]
MKAVIMAGGKGTRISLYKPFLNVCGKPLIAWAYDSVKNIVSEIYLAINPNHLLFNIFKNSIFKIFYTNDKNYVDDLALVVRTLGTPILILPVDVALITDEIMLELIRRCEKDICTMKYGNEYLGISYWRGNNFENYADIVISKKIYNINTWNDYNKANKECNLY